MAEPRFRKRTLFLVAYLVFAILPIYWMVTMSFKTNEDILSAFSLWPRHFTWDNYRVIFTDPSWYSGYINSLIYVAENTVMSLAVALPAAYAFSRYSFLGDKHVFFWLLTNRMTPPAPSGSTTARRTDACRRGSDNAKTHRPPAAPPKSRSRC